MTNAFDPLVLREEFPIFANNPGLVFLDTAASAQKPRSVIDGLADFYRHDYANIHRGVYALSARATARHDKARETIRKYLNARDTSEIVFVRNATEAINLVAQTWGRATLKPGDEVVISVLEHHANIVPWQILRDQIGIELRVVPLNAQGGFDLDAYRALLSPRVKLVSVTHVANVTGHVTPVGDIVALAHRAGAAVLLDGCQAAPRMPVDLRALNCEFYVFSGHKCYGPTGIGVLYGKQAMLERMPPWQGGGDMIETVTFEQTTFQPPPLRFEAGTPDISGAIGLDLSLTFIESLSRPAIQAHEIALTAYALDRLSMVPGIRIIPAGGSAVGVISFEMEGIHPHDLATILDQQHVAVRAGQHCAQPLIDHLGLTATVRASFGVYSHESDVDALVDALRTARKLFGV